MVSEREFLIFASYNSVAKQLLFLMIIYMDSLLSRKSG